jgi:hypothetical protein
MTPLTPDPKSKRPPVARRLGALASRVLGRDAAGGRSFARLPFPQLLTLQTAFPGETGQMTVAEFSRDRLWTQPEAPYYLGVSARYLREGSRPKVLLPGTGRRASQSSAMIRRT